jgi:signal transduction histidine kinase
MQVINGLHGITIHADRHRLEQVLLNLALNAFRFMPSGGWLSIRGIDCAAEGSQGVEIVVRDTGPGIVPGDLPRIFEAGFSTRPGSSGLGLAVCRRILEQHGGSISVESRHGYGATFRLRLPRNGATGATEATGAGHSPEDSSGDCPEHSPEHSSEHVAEPAVELFVASGAQL